MKHENQILGGFFLLLAGCCLPASPLYAGEEMSAGPAVEKAMKGVLLVTTDRQVGSGFVLAGGLLATNYHVLEGSCAISIIRPDGLRVSPTGYLVANKDNDFAILKLELDDLPPVALGDSDGLKIGQSVYAIGFPQIVDLVSLGSVESALTPTLSDGIVSGRRRLFGADILQVSTPISPGSSGGPIVTVGGQVVGIATYSMRESQNMNFAVPIAFLKPFLMKAVKKLDEAPWCKEEPDLTRVSSPPPKPGTSGKWSFCMVVERGRKADMWCYASQEQCREAEQSAKVERSWTIDASCHPVKDDSQQR